MCGTVPIVSILMTKLLQNVGFVEQKDNTVILNGKPYRIVYKRKGNNEK